jgi:very-short-patch-repair endonuclease
MALRAGSEGEALSSHLAGTRQALTRSMIERDYGQYALRSCVATGALVRLLPGIYVHADCAAEPDVRIRAASAWIAPVGAVTGAAACWMWGAVTRAPSIVTLQVPPALHRAAPGWVRLVRPAVPIKAVDVNGVRVVNRADAVAQAWCELRDDRAVGMVIDAVRARVTTPLQITEAVAAIPRVRARAQLLDTLQHLESGVTSFLEHKAKSHVFPERLFPELAWQYPVHAAGRNRVLDAFAADARLALEFDGTEYHSGDAARLADIQRDAELAAIGIQVLRLSYESVMRRPQWCRDMYRAARAMRLADTGRHRIG